jgi:hypothetical protein
MRSFVQVNSQYVNYEQNMLRDKATSAAQIPSSFADMLQATANSQSGTPDNGGTVTLNFHDMTGDQFFAVEKTLESEGKTTQEFISPSAIDRTPTDLIAMYGSWASTAAANHDPKGAAGFLDAQKVLSGQGDSAGNITVDAATYNAALAALTANAQ